MFDPITLTFYWWHGVAFLIILAMCAFLDPIRDFMREKLTWMQWHSVKWSIYYPPLLTLWVFVILIFGVEVGLYTLVGCFLLWRFGLRVSGQKYDSFWMTLLKNWWDKIRNKK